MPMKGARDTKGVTATKRYKDVKHVQDIRSVDDIKGVTDIKSMKDSEGTGDHGGLFQQLRKNLEQAGNLPRNIKEALGHFIKRPRSASEKEKRPSSVG
jgi:hypothetical protein